MKNTLFAMVLTAVLLPATASAVETIKLENPEMYISLPDADKATGRAVVILPGGGYMGHAMDYEGYDWAPFFNERGIATLTLRYGLPKEGHRDIPMDDVRLAMRTLRDKSSEWRIDPTQIGVMGSSAGGHLAATVSNNFSGADRPAFQILFYPVISMDPEIAERHTRREFIGRNPDAGTQRRYSNELAVTAQTPRAILLLTDDDELVKPDNSVLYYNALHAAGVPATMHIYPTGHHGFGYRADFRYRAAMLRDLSDWLTSF